MNGTQKFALTFFSAVLLTGATVALPSNAAAQAMPNASSKSQTSPSAQAQRSELQSVSGKITSISGKTFTLSTTSSPSSSPGSQQFQSSQSAGAGQSMTFEINDNTTVSGKLAVGANADVTYRTEAGKNIAVSIRIAS